ncbi:MAG: hypothetical protein RLY31_3068 [Bacteroidota bacterium]|jgi:hypothetical protein
MRNSLVITTGLPSIILLDVRQTGSKYTLTRRSPSVSLPGQDMCLPEWNESLLAYLALRTKPFYRFGVRRWDRAYVMPSGRLLLAFGMAVTSRIGGGCVLHVFPLTDGHQSPMPTGHPMRSTCMRIVHPTGGSATVLGNPG